MLPFLAPIDRRPTRGLKRWTACRNRCTCLSLRHNTLSSTIEVLRRPVESAEYTGDLFATACRRAGVTQSMGRTGSALDNAAAESFNSTLEFELLRGRRFATREQARR